jgi:chromosome segregation ATPase
MAFAAVLTWFVLYHQARTDETLAALVTKTETALRGLDGRQDTLERAQQEMLREQARRTALVVQIPAVQALLQAQQTHMSDNTITLKAVEDRATTNAQAIGELKKETLDLRVRMNDLLYVKRVHPPPKKERPYDAP